MKKNFFSYRILIIAVIMMTGIAVSFGQNRINNPAVRSVQLDKQLSAQTQIFADTGKLGSVSFNGIAFAAGETVTLSVEELNVFAGSPVMIGTWTVPADDKGMFMSAWYMANTAGRYRVTAIGDITAFAVSADFSGPEVVLSAGNLDQCANGAVGGVPVQCIGAAWQNGNLNQNQAHYTEGESVPYRVTFIGMAVGSTNTVTIEWDAVEGGHHALDYLTTFNASETDADPCTGAPNCTLPATDTYPIPLDPMVADGHDGIPGNGDDITQTPGVFTMYGGDITGVSGYTYVTSGSNVMTSITITFTATTATPVLAWGGHIATRDDWGFNNSAIALTGSPFHMRLLDINGTGGNQDRSLSSLAAVFPANVTIIKLVNNLDLTWASTFSFGFTSSENFGMTSFSLVDSDPAEFAGASITNNQIVHFTAANAITVSEDLIASGRYTLLSLACTEIGDGTAPIINTTWDFATRTATIVPDEGEVITCTFSNTEQRPTAAAVPISGRIVDQNGYGVRNVYLNLSPVMGGETFRAISNSFGYYTFDNIFVGETYVLSLSSKVYTFDPPFVVVSLKDAIDDLNFIAIGPQFRAEP